MPLILTILALFGPILLANWLVVLDNENYNRLFDRLLFLASLPFLPLGLLFWLLPDFMARLPLNITPQFQVSAAYGAAMAGTALWSVWVSFRTGRQVLARRLPLNPASPVHALALVLSGVLVGSTLLTLTQGGLEGLAETAVSTPLADYVFQQLLFVLLALLGVGLLIRRRLPALRKRLGLERPSWSQIRFGLRWIAILVFIQWAVGLIWALTDPDQSALVEGISDVLLGNFDTLGEWIIVALGAGIGEELLFRGALQPVFGLWFTSIIFAIAHIQYGFTLITALVFIISAVLGYIRRRTNTTVAIFVHAGYDFVLGLFYLLATYLDQFV